MLENLRAEHRDARARVASHVSRADRARAASEASERNLALERAELTDGCGG